MLDQVFIDKGIEGGGGVLGCVEGCGELGALGGWMLVFKFSSFQVTLLGCIHCISGICGIENQGQMTDDRGRLSKRMKFTNKGTRSKRQAYFGDRGVKK